MESVWAVLALHRASDGIGWVPQTMGFVPTLEEAQAKVARLNDFLARPEERRYAYEQIARMV